MNMDLIVNVSENWGIGMGDRLLVSIREDLRRFRSLTIGKTVVLGRKTLQTFPGGRPLKGRRNIILSRDPNYQVPDAEVVHNVQELFSILGAEEEVCVIGGASIYTLLLPYCRRAFVTKTAVTLPADCFFPNLDELPNWQLEAQEPPMEENGITYRYVNYVNLSPKAV